MNKNEIIRIFKNMGFQIVNHEKLGELVIMSPEHAFVFSATTGAKYLIYENGVTMKGRSEVFIHRSVFKSGHLIYSPGLFSRSADGYLTEGNSADYLIKQFPSVFSGIKKILVCDILENELSNVEKKIYGEIKEADEDPVEYIIYKNFLSKSGIGESFQEYLASLYYIRKGYIVENQVPWFQQNYIYHGRRLNGGIPDFSAFHSSISNVLFKYGIINTDSGISIHLLPVLKNFREDFLNANNITGTSYSHKLIIGEAKTSSSSLENALKQLDKYASVDIADEFFTLIPDVYVNGKYGSMYITNDYRVKLAEKRFDVNKDEREIEDDKWINTYIKMLILGNIPIKAVYDFISRYRKTHNLSVDSKYNSSHLLDAVQNTENEELIIYIRNTIFDLKTEK